MTLKYIWGNILDLHFCIFLSIYILPWNVWFKLDHKTHIKSCFNLHEWKWE